MKRIVILILAATLAFAFAWMAGCSDNATNSAPKAAGDTTSFQFQMVSDAFELADGVDGMVIDGTFELIGTFMAPAAPRQNQPASAADPVFHEASMYWYCEQTAAETTFVSGYPDSVENISDWSRVDSLQFVHSGTPTMYPNMDSLSEIKAGVQLIGRSQLTHDSVQARRHIDILGEPGSLAAQGDVVINAGGTTSAQVASTFYHYDSATTCQLAMNMASNWRNLSINLANIINSGGCPSAGTIGWTGQLALDCSRADDTLNIDGGWTYLQTFNGQQVTRTFENATTRWTVIDSCGARQQLSPFQRSANVLK